MRSAQNMTLTGVVAATGLTVGSGWTAVKTSTGNYLITVAPGYKLVGATAAATGTGSSKFAGVDGFTDTSFVVSVITTAPAFIDGQFSFTAIVQAR